MFKSSDLISDEELVRIIDARHWGDGESLRAIERSFGVGNDVLRKRCQTLGIAIRGQRTAAAAHIASREVKRGEKHWAWGLTKDTHPMYKAHSERMKKRNPSAIASVRNRMSRAMAQALRVKPTPHELIARQLLESSGASFVFQYPIGRHIVDFAFVRDMVVLEIDGKGHASRARQASDLVRDQWLIERGWKILRVWQSNLSGPRKLFAVLKQHVPDLNIPGDLPATARQYRVLVRDAENPTGIKV